jgi:hypothetical protein
MPCEMQLRQQKPRLRPLQQTRTECFRQTKHHYCEQMLIRPRYCQDPCYWQEEVIKFVEYSQGAFVVWAERARALSENRGSYSSIAQCKREAVS